MTNALFVVRKSGNERVKSEGKKNVHAFVNGIVVNKYAKIDNEFCFPVRYDPYTMDYFHYQRDVNNKLVWLPVDKHWIGNVTLTIINVKPIIYADIDKLSDTKNGKSNDTKGSKEFGVTDLLNSQFLKSSKIGGEFLRRKIKILENKNKIKKKTIVI